MKKGQGKLFFTFFSAGVVFFNVVLTLAIIWLMFKVCFQIGVTPHTEIDSLGGTLFLVAIVLSCTIISYGISFLVSRFFQIPLTKIMNCMTQLTEGDYSTHLNFGKALDRMTMFRNTEQVFNKMVREFEHKENLSNDFVNNFSHEFKTPIVSIYGFAKLLNKKELPPEKQRKYLSIIEQESKRLSTMATNVLSLVKIENQELLTDVARYNLSEQLRNSLLLLESKWQDKDYTFQLDFDEHFIYANKELLSQVWINLLDNAIKFTPPGETVTINVAESPKQFTVRICNTGVEIPPESKEYVFNKFYKAETPHAKEGNGIGLAIVKKIVTLHNGTITLESGGGKTEFTVVLPK